MAVRADAPRSPATARPRTPRKVAVAEPAWEPVPEKAPVHEPVWLMRSVLVLFLVGFAAFLAREVRNFLQALP